jgi:uncharacterized protein YecT (DUF1311 family)
MQQRYRQWLSPVSLHKRLALRLAVVGPFFWAMAAAAQPEFTADATQDCVAEALVASPSRSSSAVLDCAGRSAQVCMQMPEGDTTLGMIECLEHEWRYWDARLEQAVADRLAVSRANDADSFSMRGKPLSEEESLQALQAAWQAFREAACLYEMSLWRGGSGQGPASMACHLQETARQALKLEGWWAH